MSIVGPSRRLPTPVIGIEVANSAHLVREEAPAPVQGTMDGRHGFVLAAAEIGQPMQPRLTAEAWRPRRPSCRGFIASSGYANVVNGQIAAAAPGATAPP